MQKNNECAAKTDEELVILSLSDSDWFFCLASRYEEPLLRYVRRVSGMQKEDTEDILQDVFIKTYQNLNSFDPRLKFSSWVYRIAHNESVSAIRKKSIRQTLYLDESDMHKFADTLNLTSAADSSFDREDIEKVLEKLDKKYREVITLRYLEEKDYVEIADILKKPISTVGNLISRGKKVFKSEYELIHRKEQKHG